jgi:hypothetical protein
MTTTLEALQDGLSLCRQQLWQAAWSPSWEAAKPRAIFAQEELAAALAVLCLENMPDDYSDALPHVAMWESVHTALRLITQAIDEDNATLGTRALVSQAMQELDKII